MKPLGVWELSADYPRPAWATFAALRSDDDDAAWQRALDDARTHGTKYVLLFYGLTRQEIIDDHRNATIARLETTGMRRHLGGVAYLEEWYQCLRGGGIPGVPWEGERAEKLDRVRYVHAWCSLQHRKLARALPDVPIVWIENYVNDDMQWGPDYYQPLPSEVHVIAPELYLPAGARWDLAVEPFIAHTVKTTALPILPIVQAFRGADPQWQVGPTTESLAATKRWIAHPRIIGAWVFTWRSYPTVGVQGLADFAEQQPAVLRALGVAAW